MATKLMIDSASDISQAEAQEKGIILIPMVINFGEEEFLDGVDMLPEQFYEKLVKSTSLPKTSQINPFRWEEEFERNTENGDELVVITISSKLSGTYASACQAAEKFGGKVQVVDSLNACAGERLLGMLALDLIKQGKSAKEVAEILEEKKKKIQVFAMIDTLKYLKLGGRLSAAAAFAGTLLSLKPMVCVKDGEVKVIGKVVGMKKAIAYLDNAVQEKGGIDCELPHCMLWSGMDKSNLEKYVAETTSFVNIEAVPQHILGGTIGTHIGPGAIGLAFFAK